MSFDSPRLRGYTFANPPRPMNMNWEVIQNVQELADGGIKQRILGYKFVADLIWEEGWLRNEDYSAIFTIANDPSATLTFIPKPDSEVGTTFAVTWLNKVDFISWQGHFEFYQGSIKLESITITATATVIP